MPEINKIDFFLWKIRTPLRAVDYSFKLVIFFITCLLILNVLAYSYGIYYKQKESYLLSGINLEAYSNLGEATKYFRELVKSESTHYYPYLGYKTSSEFNGIYIHSDARSVRKTATYCNQTNNSLRIFVFGGSAVWGYGVNDNETIPSFLSEYLCNKNISVDITNFGINGYVNTQSLIQLELELINNNIPNIVIFYDGLNEISSAYNNQQAGVMINSYNLKEDFDKRKKLNILGAIKYSSLSNGIKVLLPKKETPFKDPLGKEMVYNASRIFLGNLRIGHSLSNEFNFKTFNYIQPSLFDKEIKSDSEKTLDHPGVVGFKESFSGFKEEVVKNSNIKDSSVYFSNYPETIFIDFVHINFKGNRIIARAMGEEIIRYLNNNN